MEIVGKMMGDLTRKISYASFDIIGPFRFARFDGFSAANVEFSFTRGYSTADGNHSAFFMVIGFASNDRNHWESLMEIKANDFPKKMFLSFTD